MEPRVAEGSVLVRGPTLDATTVAALIEGRHSDPFAVLGPHRGPDGPMVRVLLPGARRVEVWTRDKTRRLGTLTLVSPTGLFEGTIDRAEPYLLSIEWPAAIQETEDPYGFGLLLGPLDLHLFSEGRHLELGRQFDR